MKALFTRIRIFLFAALGALILVSGSTGVSGASRRGLYVTPSGFRTPIHGMTLVRDASGALGTSCGELTQSQIDSARFGRNVSRAMRRSSPLAVIREGSGAAFDITYTDPEGFGFNDPTQGAARRRALEASAAAWSRVIQGTVTITIEAYMEKPEETESGDIWLAKAGPNNFFLINNKAYPASLAWQLQGRRNPDDDTDISVIVNPDINWEYATNGASARDKVSFVYTMIHEIGHGLGYVASFDPETGKLGHDPIPFIFDTFVNRRNDTTRLVMNRPDHEVKDDLRSRELFFNGPAANDASQRSIKPGPMIRLYAPDPYEPGSSVSHVDYDTYADFKTGLMVPRDFGGGTDKIDILTLGIMKDMGYQLVPNAVTARVPRN